MSIKLTEKQKLFCNEYIKDLNATQAAKRAGYSHEAARQLGYETLTKHYIQEYISELRQERAQRMQVDQDDVLRVWKNVAMFDVRNLYDDDGNLKKISELDDDTAAAIVALDFDDISMDNQIIGKTTKIKLADKLKATDMIARHLGMYEVDNKQKKTSIIIQDENLAILNRLGIEVDDNTAKPEGA